ncbi:IPT/TIG domain-containing protein [Planctomicrobium sp. SH527]|uniref:IPT/TIG domain-containing protein n=1 Tax=Planctomicrobium sp. SH527 TaxID=3448123 RepID=UPI003F5CB649
MHSAQETQEVTIQSISPATVKVGWEGLVKIQGTGFDRCSFAMFNSATPTVVDRNDSQLVVEIHPDLTANPGRISVKVHTTESGSSGEVAFLVKA